MASPNGQDTTKVSFARDLGFFDASMIGIGAMIGAEIFVLTGIAAGEAAPQGLDALPQEVARGPYRVLVPLANPSTVASLPDISIPIAKANDGDLVVTTTVEVPIQLPIQEGMKYINHRMPLLRTAQAYAHTQDMSLVSDIRVAHGWRKAFCPPRMMNRRIFW